MYNKNLVESDTAVKQRAEGRRICWIIVLARGVVHVELMPENWKVNASGLAFFVHKLPQILHSMLGPQAKLPRKIFTDRGTGMYAPTGKIANKYYEAVQNEGFDVYWGPDASRQSPDMPDMLLHETAVSWFRKRMAIEKSVVLPWHETRQQWQHRARTCVRYINTHYDVAGLCREFPARVQAVMRKEGDRLPK